MPLTNTIADLHPTQAYIEHISVGKQYRNTGLGRELLSVAINNLYWRGYSEVVCGVLPSNKPSIKMIEAAGFESTVDIHYQKLFSKEVWL
jgi:ribosomal protein S18 acetylase RimI-like enzyme